METKSDEDHREALRLKTLAETTYTSSPTANVSSALSLAAAAHRLSPSLDGLPELLTSLQILSSAATSPPPSLYSVLSLPPFSPLSSIKKQYRKLALTLHPDKNPFPASEEAFKLVGDAFRVLSDKIKRNEYDVKLRVSMQEEVLGEVGDMFRTECDKCRVLHQFERKYLGYDLVCSGCKESFKAIEVLEKVSDKNDENEDVRDSDDVGTRSSARIRARGGGVKWKMSGGGEVFEKKVKSVADSGLGSKKGTGTRGGSERLEKCKSKSARNERNVVLVCALKAITGEDLEKGKSKRAKIGEVLERSVIGECTKRNRSRKGADEEEGLENKSNRMEIDEEGITLAEMQMLAKRKEEKKIKLKRAEIGEEGFTLTEMQTMAKRKVREEKMKLRVKEKDKENERRCGSRVGDLETERRRTRKCRNVQDTKRKNVSEDEDEEGMAVEDSDFYDFDRDRTVRSFKTGQVWAIYDDDDGMPRHYALMDGVNFHPFRVRLSWLEAPSNDYEQVRFRICCGMFKVVKKTSIDYMNIFSHVVDAERAAREVYRIYPRKGSVWALYNENTLENNGGNQLHEDKGCYDLVVCLTSYNESFGLSLAYLEKVGGFKSVFKRREIGSHAIKWVEKVDVRLFSHQIPARKLSEKESPDLSKDCWELDPASLPPDLLTIGRHK